jgi:hypothetical protein
MFQRRVLCGNAADRNAEWCPDFIRGGRQREEERANACDSSQFFVVLWFHCYWELHGDCQVINWDILCGNFMVSLHSLPKRSTLSLELDAGAGGAGRGEPVELKMS